MLGGGGGKNKKSLWRSGCPVPCPEGCGHLQERLEPNHNLWVSLAPDFSGMTDIFSAWQ